MQGDFDATQIYRRPGILSVDSVSKRAGIVLTSDVSNSTDKTNNTTYVATVTLTTDTTHHQETLDFLLKNTSSSSVGGFLTGIVVPELPLTEISAINRREFSGRRSIIFLV